MERLKRYLHQEISESRLMDEGEIALFGARHRFVPDELADFDEVELAIEFEDTRDLVLTLTLEKGRIERLLLGWGPAGEDDEDMRALDEESLRSALDARGSDIVDLLSYLTG